VNTDDCRVAYRNVRRRRCLRSLSIAMAFPLGLLGASLTFSQSAAVPAPVVVGLVIDNHVYSPSDLPARYEAYVRTAAPKETIRIDTPCPNRLPVTGDVGRRRFCVVAFFPKYPHHHLPSSVKQRLVAAIRAMGGEFVDWAVSDGDFVGLGVTREKTVSVPPLKDPELTHVSSFLVVRLDTSGRPKVPSRFETPNDDIQAMMGSPDSFCVEPLPRLILAWSRAAFVGCGGKSGDTPFTPFFVFPVKSVQQWWAKPWVIGGRGAINGSRFPLCNIFWDVLPIESGSSQVTIPAIDPTDPNGGRIGERVTLDLATGRFSIGGKQIYPCPPNGPNPAEPKDDKSR